MKPRAWKLKVNGALQPREYLQRAAARGAAMILQAQGNSVQMVAIW
jgi:predicted aminopeptidase